MLRPFKRQTRAVYWYHYDTKACGFTDVTPVKLNAAGTSNGENKFSWHLNGDGGYRSGGYRSGMDSAFSNQEWRKVIYRCNENCCVLRGRAITRRSMS